METPFYTRAPIQFIIDYNPQLFDHITQTQILAEERKPSSFLLVANNITEL